MGHFLLGSPRWDSSQISLISFRAIIKLFLGALYTAETLEAKWSFDVAGKSLLVEDL